jgi:hypothetical protein
MYQVQHHTPTSSSSSSSSSSSQTHHTLLRPPTPTPNTNTSSRGMDLSPAHLDARYMDFYVHLHPKHSVGHLHVHSLTQLSSSLAPLPHIHFHLPPTFSHPCSYQGRSLASRPLARALLPALMLYACCTHTSLILYSYCTHAALMLYSCCTHTVLMLYSCCTHAVLMLYSCCTHTALMLYSYCTHTAIGRTLARALLPHQSMDSGRR